MQNTGWDKLAEEDSIHAAIAAVSEEHERRKGEADISLLKKQLNDGIILDLGCGYGRVAKYLLPERSFSKYIGLDSSSQMLSLFRARYDASDAEQTTPLTIIQSDITKIPLENESVDNVIVSSVFLHNSKADSQRAISEIYRVLKPMGKVLLLSNFPNANSLLGLQGMTYLALLRLIGKERNGPVRYFSRLEVENMLTTFRKVFIWETGFSVLPSRILILPATLNTLYRRLIRNPVNKFLKKIFTPSLSRASCEWFDAVCEK